MGDHDMEIIGLNHVQLQDWHPKPLDPNEDTSFATEIDSDDDDSASDDYGNRGLLVGINETTHGHEQCKPSSTKLWPEIKSIVVESAPTLLMTTISLSFTGKLLDKVSHWRVMQEVDQLIMIIPVVLNLNGNLEMNLSARLATAANVGEFDDPMVRRSMIIGSLALLQVQTVSVSFVSACIAFILGRFVQGSGVPSPSASPPSSGATNSTILTLYNVLVTYSLESRQFIRTLPIVHQGRKSGIKTLVMVAATTMTAASLSGIFLGSFMCALVVICHKYNRDPDNIVPAIASCLGDLVTLVMLGFVSSLFIPFIQTSLPFFVGILVLCSAIACFVFTLKNKHVRPLLTEGWSPLLGAMVISSGTGIVLDMFVSRYEGFALLAVVISGLPGAAGSILVSRLSTSLHATARLLQHGLPSYSNSSKNLELSPHIATLLLLIITIPVEIIFLSILDIFGWLNLPLLFVAFSIVFFCCAVFVSLVIARLLTNYLWSKECDPDMYALPIHSALVDLIGQLLLVLCYEIVSDLGGEVRMKT